MAKSKSKSVDADLIGVKNSELLIKLTKSSSKSIAWSYFGYLCFRADERVVESQRDKWFCNVCFSEADETRLLVESGVKVFSSSISTTTLINHVQKDHKISLHSKTAEQTKRSIQSYFATDRTATTSSSKKEAKFVLTRDLVLFCCRDLLPFSLVDGQGLRDFFQKYHVAETDDLPHRTTIARALTTVYDDCRAWLIDYIKAESPPTVAVTFDGWSDKYRRRSYMTLTLHFVDKQFALVNLTLSTNHFADRHKGENVLPYIESLLDCYGLTQKNIYMVTDAAKNMKKTCNLGSYENISCVGHALHNLVSVDGIKKTEPIQVLLKKIKDIVKALRYRTDEFEKLTKDQSALAAEISEWSEMFLIYDDVDDVDNDLESLASSIEDSSDHRHTLKLDVKTRWHSVLMMVESLVGYNKNVINLMLHKTDNSELVLLNSDILLAKELVDFLRHFQRITAIFSGSSYATMNYYVVFRSEISSLLESEVKDSYEIKLLKANMLSGFDHRFPLSDVVVLASLLDPRFQNLLDVKNYLLASQTTPVEFLVKGSADIASAGVSSSPNNSSITKSESYVEELAEKHSTLSSVARTNTSQTAVERECYLLLSMHNKIKITNVLTYWKDHARLMPTLSSLATQVFAIPATSTPSERNFSIAGIIVNQKRTQITPDNLDKVLFMHNNYDYLKDFVLKIQMKE